MIRAVTKRPTSVRAATVAAGVFGVPEVAVVVGVAPTIVEVGVAVPPEVVGVAVVPGVEGPEVVGVACGGMTGGIGMGLVTVIGPIDTSVPLMLETPDKCTLL